MQKVKILKTTQGSQDGISVETFREGEVHTIEDSLVAAFVEMGAAELVVSEPETPTMMPDENAAHESAPEKKGLKKGKK